MISRLTRLGAALLATALPCFAQWDVLPGDPVQPVLVEGFHALHDDGSELQAFSAVTQTWTEIGPSGSLVLGTGDWTAAFLEPGGGFASAYSARLNAAFPSPATAGSPYRIVIEDDVVLILRTLGSAYEALAFSAQTGTWDMAVFPEDPLVSSSRFVIGCHLEEAREVWGFGAREGRWQVIPVVTCGPGIADGNCIGWEHESDLGDATVLAFSGISNEFLFSPFGVAGNFDLRVDHDVMATNIAQPGSFRSCGFSAYTTAWVTSPIEIDEEDVLGITVTDKVALVEAVEPYRFEAMGALAQAWIPVFDPSATLVRQAEDNVVVQQSVPGAELTAFSGMCGGWVSQPAPGTLLPIGTPDYCAMVLDLSGNLYAFSPIQADWAVLSASGAVAQVGDCMAVAVDTSGNAWGWSSRWNDWVPAPAPDPSLSYETFCAGSAGARIGGPSLTLDERIEFFDERSNAWLPAAMLSGLSDVKPSSTRNAVLVEDGSAVLAYSAQRSGLVPSPGGLATTSIVEEDVLAYRQPDGAVFAFGSPGFTHSMYDYPLDTETNHWSELSTDPLHLRVSSPVPAGTTTVLGQSALPFFPGAPTAFGRLFLFPPLSTSIAPPAGAGGVSVQDLPLPLGSGCTVVWGQNARLGPVQLLDVRPEPFPIF